MTTEIKLELFDKSVAAANDTRVRSKVKIIPFIVFRGRRLFIMISYLKRVIRVFYNRIVHVRISVENIRENGNWFSYRDSIHAARSILELLTKKKKLT